MNKKTMQFYEMLYPEQLAEDECIRMVLLRKDPDGTKSVTKYVRSVEEFCEVADNYRYTHDVYCQLATNRGCDNGTRESQYMRSVILLDFDLKELPEIASITDSKERLQAILALLQDKVPLFVHTVNWSGHGYHCYLCVNTTTEIERLSETNKSLASVCGADEKACLVTQIVRVPGSFNHKQSDGTYDYQDSKKWQYVNTVFNHGTRDDYKFHPHSLKQIEKKLKDYQMQIDEAEGEYAIEPQLWNYKNSDDLSPCLCTQRAFQDGVKQGERNFFLGRIIHSLVLQGWNHKKIREEMREWNQRCRPPKPEKELETEIDGWLKGILESGYNLSGCWWRFPNGDGRREMLARYCDRPYCQCGKNDVESKRDGGHYVLNNKAITDKRLKISGGNDLLILSLINYDQEAYGRRGFTVKDLYESLYSSVRKKYYLNKETLYRLLIEMESDNLIEIKRGERTKPDRVRETDKIKLSRRMRDYSKGNIGLCMNVINAVINKVITRTSFKVYVNIARNINEGLSCTLVTLSQNMDMDMSQISRHIQILKRERLIQIYKQDTLRGWEYNEYRLYI